MRNPSYKYGDQDYHSLSPLATLDGRDLGDQCEWSI